MFELFSDFGGGRATAKIREKRASKADSQLLSLNFK